MEEVFSKMSISARQKVSYFVFFNNQQLLFSLISELKIIYSCFLQHTHQHKNKYSALEGEDQEVPEAYDEFLNHEEGEEEPASQPLPFRFEVQQAPANATLAELLAWKDIWGLNRYVFTRVYDYKHDKRKSIKIELTSMNLKFVFLSFSLNFILPQSSEATLD